MNSTKGKAEKSEKPAEIDPLEAVFDQLEKKLEALAARLRSAHEENANLRAAAATANAERDKTKAELTEAKAAAGRQGEAAAAVRKYEAEREEIRARIERLIGSLEASEGSAGARKP
jgi:septation ring formation regulator EzrA